MAASTSTPYVAGPTNWFTRTGAGATWEHLGQCETDTQLALTPDWDDVMIDGGGFRMPYDRQFMGAMGSVSGDLVFYHEDVLNRLLNFLNNFSSTPGQWQPGTIGSLARTEGLAHGLVIASQYGGKAAYGNMNSLFYFPFVTPVGSWSMNQSARVRRVRIAFDCLPLLDGKGGGVLYYNAINFSLPAPS